MAAGIKTLRDDNGRYIKVSLRRAHHLHNPRGVQYSLLTTLSHYQHPHKLDSPLQELIKVLFPPPQSGARLFGVDPRAESGAFLDAGSDCELHKIDSEPPQVFLLEGSDERLCSGQQVLEHNKNSHIHCEQIENYR